MSPQLLHLIGIAFVAITVGYMAGGSGTPVASVAIPAVFGLVVSALGLLQAAQPSKDLLEYLKTAGENADTQPDIVDYRKRTKSAPARVGVALIVFCSAYLAAATFGAKVRIDGLLTQKQEALEFPWAKSATSPPTIAAALEWLALQARLVELGYDSDRISSLYAIQVAEWESLASQAQAATSIPDKSETPAKPQSVKPSGADELLKEWLKHGAVGRNPLDSPFAHQPPKELIEKLKELGLPGKPTSGAIPG